jgi:hypothetical protein
MVLAGLADDLNLHPHAQSGPLPVGGDSADPEAFGGRQAGPVAEGQAGMLCVRSKGRCLECEGFIEGHNLEPQSREIIANPLAEKAPFEHSGRHLGQIHCADRSAFQ